MKSIEKLFYKIILDLVTTLNKYNVNATYLNLKTKSYINSKITQQPYNDTIAMRLLYNVMKNDMLRLLNLVPLILKMIKRKLLLMPKSILIKHLE